MPSDLQSLRRLEGKGPFALTNCMRSFEAPMAGCVTTGLREETRRVHYGATKFGLPCRKRRRKGSWNSRWRAAERRVADGSFDDWGCPSCENRSLTGRQRSKVAPQPPFRAAQRPRLLGALAGLRFNAC